MPGERRGLGKGLEALIPSPPGATEVAVDTIVPNPRQPRQALDPQSLEELANSIREQGLVQPLVVTETDEGYQLLVGERRWRAAKLAGLEVVPVVVREVTPQQMLELALVENIQREDLNPLETASAYQQLVEEFGLTQQQVADKVGKNRATVANTLRLLKLPTEVKDSLLQGKITEGHARALLRLESAKAQLQALRTILRDGLNVRQTEQMVRRMLEKPRSRSAPAEKSPQMRALEDELRQTLGTKVNLTGGSKGGRLVIYFYSEEELQAIYDHIVRD
jgi:ParB family chromosome partitioning protein